MLQFNESFYLAQNPDVAAAIEAGVIGSAEEHYNLFGFQEGRDPNAHFDTLFYLEQNPDVAAAGVNPFDHYNLLGESEGRSPNSLFDPVFYAEQYPDIVAAGVSLFEHFINFGASEGRSPNASIASQLESGFDTEAYLAANPDVAAAIENGLFASAYEHWGLFGFKEDRSGAQNTNGDVISIGDGAPGDNPDAAPGDGDGGTGGGGGGGGGGTPTPEPFTLELLHFTDQEANAATIDNIDNLSGVLNALREEDLGNDGEVDNTLTLSSGDAIIPGLFFDASEAVFGSAGIADIQIQNELGVQAIALGNHEFDLGTGLLAGLIDGSAGQNFGQELDDDDNVVSPAVPNFSNPLFNGTDLEGADFGGAMFPYLSANLDFSTDANLAPLAVEGGQDTATLENVVTSSSVSDVNGELVGIVGATVPTIRAISSPGADLGILPEDFDSNPTPEQLDALAAVLQSEVDALLAANPSLNKVILLSHMQQISIEQELAARLTDVDIIVAGGSNTRLFDDNDRTRDGDSDQGQYPIMVENAGGTTTAVVNTDGNYKYVGRLVVDFDEDGHIIEDSYDETVSGAYATDDAGVAALGAENLIDAEVDAITDAIQAEIVATESNVFGVSDVFLNGNRSGTFTEEDPDGVRTQETNLGNLTADANLAYANQMIADNNLGDAVVVSIKNGGGIRANIGEIVVPAGGTEAIRLPNSQVLDENNQVVKPTGGISQNDIATTLAFNNGLTLLDITKTELVDFLEGAVSALPGNASGGFPQISGLKFSFDETQPEGSRVVSAGIFDGDKLIAELVRDGDIVGDGSESFRIVTLNFLANSGDPVLSDLSNPNRVDLIDLDGNNENDALFSGDAIFAANGTEQDALAEYLDDNHNPEKGGTAFNEADNGPSSDDRIQNLTFREDDVLPQETAPRINEFHYDNDGGDVGEFIEVRVDNGYDVSTLSVELYNGSNGTEYRTIDVSSGTQSSDDTFDYYVMELPANGIQNGSPDGLALVDGTEVIEFLSYEGAMTATNGTANGLTSTDIGVSEPSSTPAGQSLQRLDDGSWTAPTEETKGTANTPGGDNGGEEPTFELISSIQGTATGSLLEGQRVTVEAIVVGDFQDGGNGVDGDLNGFFLQEEDKDADDNGATSEGVFVFDGFEPDLDVKVGDLVRVTGTVAEFFGETQISDVTNIEIVSAENTLPTASEIKFPVADVVQNSDGEFIPDLEAYEGMLVTIPETMTVSDLFTLGRFGDVGLQAGGLLETYTQGNAPSVEGFNAFIQEAVSNSILLDDGFTTQNPDTIPFEIFGENGNIAGQFDAGDALSAGDTVSGLTGVLRFGTGSGEFGDAAFRINPTETPEFADTAPRDSEVPDVGGSLKVGSFNLLNFFTTLDQTGNTSGPSGLDPRGAESAAEFERQVDKMIAALAEMDADIIGLQELENEYGDQNGDGQFALQYLVNALNEATGRNYTFVDPGVDYGDTSDAIMVGMIYDADAVKIAKDTTVATLTDKDLADLNVDPGHAVFDGPGTSRAPLAATFEDKEGNSFTVVVNHFKSKGSVSPFGNNEGIGDGTGNNNEARLQAAEALDAWLATNPTNAKDSDILVLGDLNSYLMEDPIQYLLSQDDELIDFNLLGGDNQTSFGFPVDLGTAPSVQSFGALDFALASNSLLNQVTGAEEWNINAFEASALDYNTNFKPDSQISDLYAADQYRASDHDPMLIGLDLTSDTIQFVG
ncbi:ExeM/NucH family extracellular endonuclease [Labrenzia sp. R4_1]|uniref:ExeM/NucH family extracellular endonuclease n=1 Tax=Labrenzia sp. R4_1 TaxID=2821106 RepID=UPI001ADBF53C|nr:ExeM/NucH family extracellular endonuclease [Labrenzia sp. R4_1]MBO9423423.1 ExeM/NucH family extracellular endonuclease [Labrenzia sp. R4_1]